MTSQQALPQTQVEVPPGRDVATIAGGCFWCTEAVFQQLVGVDKAEPGYAGGHVANPAYHDVTSGSTGHAEAIQVVFDPSVISYHDLLAIFFTVHDPTTLNRQGADRGTQYRSAIFTHGPEQELVAKQVIDEVEQAGVWADRIVTEVVPFSNFYPAEGYHHDYFKLHPEQGYCQIVIAPKVVKFRQHYADRLKR